MNEAGYGEDVPMLQGFCRNFSRQSQDAGLTSARAGTKKQVIFIHHSTVTFTWEGHGNALR